MRLRRRAGRRFGIVCVLVLIVSACGADAGSQSDGSTRGPETVAATTLAAVETTSTTGPNTTMASTTTSSVTASPTTTTSSTTTTMPPRLPPVPTAGVSRYQDGWEATAESRGLWPAYSAELDLYVAVFSDIVRTSRDAKTWTDRSSSARLDESSAFLQAVIAAEPGFIASGHTCESGGDGDFPGRPYPCYQEPGIWTSSDGSIWQMVSRTDQFVACSAEDVQPCHANIDWVGEGPVGLVAYGHDAAGAAMWSSQHGEVWTRYQPTGLIRDVDADTLIVRDGGVLLAVQTVMTFNKDCCPTGSDTFVFESLDGMTWNPMQGGSLIPDARVLAIAASDGVVFAAGRWVRGGQWGDGIWILRDGVRWEGFTTGVGSVDHMVVSALEDGFLVVGGTADGQYTLAETWAQLARPRLPVVDVEAETIGYLPFRNIAVGPNGELATGGWVWTP